MVSGWDVAAIEAGTVLKIVGVLTVFGFGAYVGWQARGALGLGGLMNEPTPLQPNLAAVNVSSSTT